MAQECQYDGCEFPAQFHARVVTTGLITGEKRSHEDANLCQYHTNQAAENYRGNKITDVKLESI